MSRIEKALEKALQQREDMPAANPCELKVQPVGDSGDYGVYGTVPRPAIENPYLVTATDPASPVSEQYRKLRSLVVKLTREGAPMNTLLVTSTVGGEGKTVTAMNLGIVLAQEYDHSVVLVEADLRRPTVMKYLGLSADVGLSDCLLDGVDVGQALVKTGIGKLSVLPAGRSVSNPAELFSSNRMKELLDELKSRYPDRYVIVDTTPMLPFAEAHSLANIVDSVLFVVRQRYTPVAKVKEACAMLKNNTLLGVVCNDMEGVFSGNGYYGYYGYYGY